MFRQSRYWLTKEQGGCGDYDVSKKNLHSVGLKEVVGAVFLARGVLKNVVTVYLPATGNPLMNFVVHSSFARQLIVDIVVARVLESSI